MLGISHWATRATFGGILALLAAVAGPSSAQADVIKLFNLFGDFANHSTLSGTVSIDTTNGTATAIDAFAGGFEFKVITGQSSQGAEYLVSATTFGEAEQLSLVFSVGSLVGYGEFPFARHAARRPVFAGRRRKPRDVIARPRAFDLDAYGRRLRRPRLLRQSMGLFISASTQVIDRSSGKVHVGHAPPYSVVAPGSLPGKPLPDGSPSPSLSCAVIVKTVDAETRANTGINELLRE